MRGDGLSGAADGVGREPTAATVREDLHEDLREDLREDARARRRARAVTWTVLGVIALGALVEAEAWPVTAFRLFSTVRTADGASLRLVATGADGVRVTVPMPADAPLSATSHQLAELRDLPTGARREKVVAWLRLAGLDPAAFTSAAVERTAWTMDGETRERHEHGPTTVLAQVTL